MKSAINTFLVVVAVATTTHISFAQTPYDDFAPSNKKKEMLKLPEVKFTLTDKDSGYIIFDKDNHSLTYYSKWFAPLLIGLFLSGTKIIDFS